jgi:hypothetical protein
VLAAILLLLAPAGGSPVRSAEPPRTAAFDQPCPGPEDPEVCSYHFEAWLPGGTRPIASLDVEHEGCGAIRIDISALIDRVARASPESDPELRVWSVSCTGVRSAESTSGGGATLAAYDWTWIDLEGTCGTEGTGSNVCGDANHDGALDVSDAITVLGVLFRGEPRPCGDVDANEDGMMDVSDAVTVLIRLFA